MIPVHRPLLPGAAQLTPYLERIDAARWYSHRGRLAGVFEIALARHFGCPVVAVLRN